MRIGFADFELDAAEFELRQRGDLVAIEPQVFDVLLYLVSNEGRLITKEELLDEVWGDRFVSESALTSRIKTVRRALGDDGRTQKFVKTVHGRGYRFVAETYRVDGDQPGVTVASQAGAADGVIRSEWAARHNLPAERSPLFGRGDDVVAVTGLIDRHRLVSLLGIGGTGKTRLASAVGYASIDRFSHGVWFVDLTPVTKEAGDVAGAIARSIGLALTMDDVQDQLSSLLADREILLILDNCEHVLDAVSDTIDSLLEHTVTPRILVTSREPVDLADERRVAVEPLGLIDDGAGSAPAIELFTASAERFGVTLREEERDVVQRVCQELDGLPLALELAAAQLRHMNIVDLAARLGQRFELLSSTSRRTGQRQASLQAVLADTWSTLELAERDLIGQLAVFPGPFALDDVEGVIGESMSGGLGAALAALVDRSLVVHDSSQAMGRRYRILETVRLFAQQRLGDREHAQFGERHVDWCVAQLGSTLSDHYYSYDVARWCLDHYDDVRVAERSLIAAGRYGDAARLVASTGFAMHIDLGTRAAETLARIGEHLERVDEAPVRVRLHMTGAMAAMAARSPTAIAEHGQAALHLASDVDDPSVRSLALVLASWSTVFQDGEAALQQVSEAGELAASASDEDTRALADGYRAFHLALLRRWDEAIDQAEAVVARTERPGEGDRLRSGQSYARTPALSALTACVLLSDPERTASWIDELLDQPSDRHHMSASQLLAAAVYAAAGCHDEAAGVLRVVHDRLTQAGQQSLPDLLVPAAVLALRRGDEGRAARWLRAVRESGRPTQSFQMTCLYHRLRDAVGVASQSPFDDSTLEQIGQEALDWMRPTTPVDR